MIKTSGTTIYSDCDHTAIVRRERLIEAKPIAAFPKVSLKIYRAWQLTSL